MNCGEFALLRSLPVASVGLRMKRTILLLLPALFIGTACERHTAASLPAHGGTHEGSHAAAPAEHAPEAAPHPAAQPSATPEKDSHSAGPAPKFFEQQPK